MAATDHTRLRTARPSADIKSTDISRNLSPKMEASSGADPACDAETTTSEAFHGSSDTQSTDGAASTSAEPVPSVPAHASLVRARIRRQVVKVCDYLKLGSSLAEVASRSASASMYADDQSLANHLADLADLIEEQIAYLRHVAGIDFAPPGARRGPLDLPLGITTGTVSQCAPGKHRHLKALRKAPARAQGLSSVRVRYGGRPEGADRTP